MIVVVNSTPLIALFKVGKLDLLQKLFGEILIPEAVFRELTEKGKDKLGAKEIKDAKWIKSKEIQNKVAKKFLLSELDEGESEVIILAEELKADLVVMDERAGITIIDGRLKIEVIETIGVLSIAKELRLISEIKPLLDEMRAKGIWIDGEIYSIALKDAREN